MSNINLFFTIADADNDKSKIEIPVDSSLFALDTAGFVIGAAWDVINALLTGHLVAAGFSIEVDISGFTNAAANVLSDVQEKAEFVFNTTTGIQKNLSIPTFDETLFTLAGAGKDVDTTQSAITAFNTMMIDGIPDALVAPQLIQPVNIHGDDVTAFIAGHEAWGKRRR